MRPIELAKRCSDLRLPQADLARLARVNGDTVGRTFAGKHSPRLDTFNKLADAVIAEERRLLRHLIALHPAEAMAMLCPHGRQCEFVDGDEHWQRVEDLRVELGIERVKPPDAELTGPLAHGGQGRGL